MLRLEEGSVVWAPAAALILLAGEGRRGAFLFSAAPMPLTYRPFRAFLLELPPMLSLLYLPKYLLAGGGTDCASMDRAPTSCSGATSPGAVAGFFACGLSCGFLVLILS